MYRCRIFAWLAGLRYISHYRIRYGKPLDRLFRDKVKLFSKSMVQSSVIYGTSPSLLGLFILIFRAPGYCLLFLPLQILCLYLPQLSHPLCRAGRFCD